jgi:hypothetical protein
LFLQHLPIRSRAIPSHPPIPLFQANIKASIQCCLSVSPFWLSRNLPAALSRRPETGK